jgi:hypothetical protein
MRWLGAVIGSALAVGCGPIPAPPGAVDLGTHPRALQRAFDGQVGVTRLVLLLSPS